jgi:hypothetical protein
MVSFSRLEPEDILSIDLQASQRMTLGIDTASCTLEEAEELAQEREAWAVRSDGRLIACIGIRETFPGRHGVAWAILATGIGAAHLTMTRFARERIVNCGLQRVEAIVRAADAESVLEHFPGLNGQQLIDMVLTMATPECVWARLVGLRPAHVLRKFGANGETQILFERIS